MAETKRSAGMAEPHLVPLVDVTATEPAGEFGAWLERFAEAGRPMEVPCGGCTVCCRSSQFVHISADEEEALAAIPKPLQFPAPGRPGDVVLGFDESGACPMLVDGACTIYPVRPRTCREFDCRLFAAAGRGPAAPAQRELLERASRWRFGYADESARRRHAELQAGLAELDAPVAALVQAVRESPAARRR